MSRLLTTRQVADYLNVNEKMVYSLVSDKGLPATKVTGKWLFPVHLVDRWVAANTVNVPTSARPGDTTLVVAGSNDLLLDRTMARFNEAFPHWMAAFGNLGSMGGLGALKRGACDLAASHLLQDDGQEYNFEMADETLDEPPVVVHFCRREQGLLVAAGNPKGIQSPADMGAAGIRMVNRALGTGTRLLLDRVLADAGINGDRIDGYHSVVSRHLDVGLEIVAGRVDVGPGIRAVATLLGLEFVPLRWERFDLLVTRDRFFDPMIQQFLGLVREPFFTGAAETLTGYRIEDSGRILYPDAGQLGHDPAGEVDAP